MHYIVVHSALVLLAAASVPQGVVEIGALNALCIIIGRKAVQDGIDRWAASVTIVARGRTGHSPADCSGLHREPDSGLFFRNGREPLPRFRNLATRCGRQIRCSTLVSARSASSRMDSGAEVPRTSSVLGRVLGAMATKFQLSAAPSKPVLRPLRPQPRDGPLQFRIGFQTLGFLQMTQGFRKTAGNTGQRYAEVVLRVGIARS